MEKFKITKNNRPVGLKEVPELPFTEFRHAAISACSAGKRVIGLFGVNAGGSKVRMYSALADDDASSILLASTLLDKGLLYRSFTNDAPMFHIFEREFYEAFGIRPEGHPWLKPVRYPWDAPDKSNKMENYPFFLSEGGSMHEVAVGPVHAGIIEPGHFRFQCAGEKVQHLEIQLGYQHRGVEALMETGPAVKTAHLAESVCGDTVVGHASAYASLIEALSGSDAPRRAGVIRAIALELERAAMHTAGLSAIAGDIAYLMGNAVFGANRTKLINTSLLLCGSRFGRGLVRPGGVLFDINAETAEIIKKNVNLAFDRISEMAEEMFASPSVLSRLQQTGVVRKEDAVKLGLTGFAARASGIAVDAREDHPSGAYVNFPVRKQVIESGDCFARAYLRYMEIGQSVKLINEMCDNLPSGKIMSDETALSGDSICVSVVEGWRGGIVYIGITDYKGAIRKIKIKDPSFNNWYGLAVAVRNNGISDFPLCNKSFDLSYCGNDL
jgi:Ni,Fe-hydrogenase III large subunit